MKPCTKFIITLWAFFFLSFVVRGQRAVGNGTPISNGGGEVTRQELADSVSSRITQAMLDDSTAAIRGDFPTDVGIITVRQNVGGLYSDNFNVGNLKTKYPGYTYNQLKAIRQSNFTVFKTLCDSSRLQNIPVLLPAGELEIHINDGQKITVRDSTTLTIQGQNTIIEAWPITKTYDIVLFDMDDDYRQVNNKLIIKDVEFRATPFRYETYAVTLKPSGNALQAIITDSYTSGSRFETVGQHVTVSYSNAAIGFDHTITNFDSGTNTITFGQSLSGSIPSNDAGYIGLAFPEDTDIDTIEAKGQFWLEENISWTFVESIYGYGNNDKPVTIELYNVKIIGFDSGISTSNISGKIKVINSHINCHHIGISCYSSNTYIRDYDVQLLNSTFFENGFEVFAYGAGTSITAANIYGSGTYFHPNIVCNIDNCVFDNVAVNFRHYSGTGDSDNIVRDTWQCTISNSVFKETQDIYNVLFSSKMPVQVNNCSFEGGNVICSYLTNIVNCFFRNGALRTAVGDNSITNVLNCSFNETYINGGHDGSTQYSAKVFFKNCDILPTSGQYDHAIQFGGISNVLFENCEIKGRELNVTYGLFEGTTLPQEWIFRDCKIGTMTGWTFLFSILSWGNNKYRPSVIFENCELNTILLRGNQQTSENILQTINCNFTTNYGYTSHNEYWGISSKLANKYNRTLNSTVSSDGIMIWGLDPNYNTFRVTGTNGKRALFNKGGSTHISDKVTLVVYDTLVIPKYTLGVDTISNFTFSGNYTNDETISMIWDSYCLLYNGSTSVTDTLTTATGSTDFFKLRTMGSTPKTNKIIPGTITITATGGQVVTDDGMGNLYQSGVLCGWVDYQRDGVVIDFNTNPAAGVIVATYQNYNVLHSRGCWRKID